MHGKKAQKNWMAKLSGELDVLAQKSFQVGVFGEIENEEVKENAPEVVKSMNNLLNCANLLLNHARENMTMLNRMNHSGMWSMYFGEDQQINRVMFSDEFREIIGYTDRSEFDDSMESWFSKIYEPDRDKVSKEFMETLQDVTGKKVFDVEYRFQTKKEGLCWMRVAGEIVRRGGKPFEFIGTISNITVDHNNEEELDISTNKHDAIDSILNEVSWRMNVVNGD
ncbi:MAG: PAS domain-containing protein, partial [Lachnospiraceae bacterium]|nr:PAS domain-containing protein [Lachnospiraceae bacterium]